MSVMVVYGVSEFGDFTLLPPVNLRSRSPFGDRGNYARNTSHLIRQVDGHKLTLSVRSFQVPATPFTSVHRPACLPSLLRGPHASLPKRMISTGPPSY